MRVAMVVSANKYTGAAAAAEHCCRALITVDVDVRLLYLGGNNLEQRLAGLSWSQPILVKERSPNRLRANLKTLRTAASEADVVVSHLPHDHYLCVAAGVHRSTVLVRNFRSRANLRGDPIHRYLNRRIHGAVVAHSGLRRRLLKQVETPCLVLPVPLEHRFRPVADRTGWRQRLAIPHGVPLLGMVGKVAPGRGFDTLLATAARVGPPVSVLIVGHGEARPGLERRAARLGLGERVFWAGYQESGLPELYAAMDVVLFTAAGSDHGHRTISEAQACHRPVVAARLPGVSDLIEDGRTGCLVTGTPECLAAAVGHLLHHPETSDQITKNAAIAADNRRFRPTGERLAEFLLRLSASP